MPDLDIKLCVDLDGTLIRTDLLYESALCLLQRNPLYLFAFGFWLLRGKAHLKHEIARRVELDAASLPYDERIVSWLREDAANRSRVLCTASNERLAQKVADHLSFFDDVIASSANRNLSGATKARALSDRYGERGFDYAGDANADLPVWQQARHAILVNASSGVTRKITGLCEVELIFPRPKRVWRQWLRTLRAHQWLKNLLVFLSPMAGHRIFEMPVFGKSLLAFVAFCLCASGVYMLNDLLDLSADRRHPRKRLRPFAAGTVPLVAGLIGAPILTVLAFAVALLVSGRFALVLLAYYVLTLAYSYRLKRVVMLDVVILAGLYTVRIIAGAVAAGSGLSFWLLAFSMFLFLSLAMLKRYTELLAMQGDGQSTASGRGYNVSDLSLIQSLGGNSGYISVMVLALYINSSASEILYRRPQMLWLLCPLLLYWISRMWLIAHRGSMHDDPVVFAATDTISQLTFAMCAIVTILAI